MNRGKRKISKRATDVRAVATSRSFPENTYAAKVASETASGTADHNIMEAHCAKIYFSKCFSSVSRRVVMRSIKGVSHA